MSRHHVTRLPAAALQQFLEDFPEVSLHIGEGDRLLDLVRERIDCVLRAGTLTDSEMIAGKIITLEQTTIASPAYLAAFGTSKTLGDLDEHQAIGFFSTATGTALPLEFAVDGTIARGSCRASSRSAALTAMLRPHVSAWGSPRHRAIASSRTRKAASSLSS